MLPGLGLLLLALPLLLLLWVCPRSDAAPAALAAPVLRLPVPHLLGTPSHLLLLDPPLLQQLPLVASC